MLSPEKLSSALAGAEEKMNLVASRITEAREKDPEFDTKFELFTGLVLCFFGGQFQTTFAFVEAFSQAGSRELVAHLRQLRMQVDLALLALQRDAELDENANGVADVKELKNASEIWQRRLRVAYSAVDPETVRSALGALSMCVLAAITSVQLRFAKIISLGVLLGDYARKHLVEKFLLGEITRVVPLELHRWIPLGLEMLCRTVATMIAFRMTRFLVTVSTAVRGGELVLASMNKLCANRGMELLTQGPADELMAMSLVGFGIMGQSMNSGGLLRTVFNLVCFPLAISEYLLQWLVAIKSSSDGL